MNEKLKQMPNPPESAYNKVSRLMDEVLNHIGIEEFYEKMLVFAKKIQKDHPDFKQYRCYHKLVFSGLPEDAPDIIGKDFEGEDSIVAFLEGLLKMEAGKN